MARDLTVEPDGDGEYWVVEHGTYERSSVLAGQYRRTLLEHYATVDAALAAYPRARAVDCSTRRYTDAGSLADASGLSSNPPAWFDPAVAGECWDVDA